MSQLILISLFPLIALIALGHILKKWSGLEDGFWRGVEKLNYYFLFPAMIFMALAYANIDFMVINRIVQVAGIVFLIACIALYTLKSIYATQVARFGVYMQSMVRFNTYIGLALVASLLPQMGMAIFAIMLAVFIPLVNILSVLAMTKPEDKNIKGIVLALIKNPLIMSCVVASTFNALDFSLWIGLENFIKQLGACSLPLGLLTVGAALKLNGFKGDRLTLASCIFGRLLFMPFLALAICMLFGLSNIETQVLVLFFALPTASAAYILTKVLGGDSELMATIISLQTIFALLTLPFILLFIL